MKVSEVTLNLLCQQLRENAAALSVDETEYILELKNAAVAFIQNFTGIHGVDEPDDNGRMLDDYPDLVYVLLSIVAQMYDNRQVTIDKDNLNPMVASALRLHDFNIIPKEGE